MSALREVANKMLEMLEEASLADPALAAEIIYKIGVALPSFRAALAQEQAGPTGKQDLQVESVATVAENATTQQRVGDAPPSDYRRGYWDGFAIGKREGRIEAEDAALAQQQAEPLNLSDRAVQKRLAAQWGFVPAEQAEPAQEPVAWECKAGGLKRLTQRQYDAQPDNIKRHYTRIAPFQRTMVPLTEGEIFKAASEWLGYDDKVMNLARAVEKASWEKNHGQA